MTTGFPVVRARPRGWNLPPPMKIAVDVLREPRGGGVAAPEDLPPLGGYARPLTDKGLDSPPAERLGYLPELIGVLDGARYADAPPPPQAGEDRLDHLGDVDGYPRLDVEDGDAGFSDEAGVAIVDQ